jgi:hypothetical protein
MLLLLLLLLQFGVSKRNLVSHILVLSRLTVIVKVTIVVLIGQLTNGTRRGCNVAFPPHVTIVVFLVLKTIVADSSGVQCICAIVGKLENEYSVLLTVTILAIHRTTAVSGAAAHADSRHIRTRHTARAVTVIVVDAGMGSHNHIVVDLFQLMHVLPWVWRCLPHCDDKESCRRLFFQTFRHAMSHDAMSDDQCFRITLIGL